jgi:hypothetical protein
MQVIRAGVKLLLQLRQQIEQFTLTAELLRPSENADVSELMAAAGAKREAQLRKYTVFAIHSHRANYDNVLALSRAVLRYLGGKDADPQRPYIVVSPIPDEAAKISAERISDDEIKTWLG